MNSTPRADSVDPKLLEILVCPVTRGRLEYDAERQELVSRAAHLAYRSARALDRARSSPGDDAEGAGRSPPQLR